MDKILLIDKPSGISSFDVIRRLRNKIGMQRMGYAGTLDPLATGLLIIGIGDATKNLDNYVSLSKEYEVLIEFGKNSTTYDADGEISNGVLRGVDRKEFENVLKNFIGEILQMPPIFSAKKIKGVRAYDLARKGKEVKLEPKSIKIYKIEILNWDWPFVRLRVNCGKGTYIRSLAHDIGERLGCGGYVKELRRTAIGEFKVENAEQI